MRLIESLPLILWDVNVSKQEHFGSYYNVLHYAPPMPLRASLARRWIKMQWCQPDEVSIPTVGQLMHHAQIIQLARTVVETDVERALRDLLGCDETYSEGVDWARILQA